RALAPFPTRRSSDLYVADHAAAGRTLDVQFLQHAVLDQGNPGLARRHVDQDFLRHPVLPHPMSPNARSRVAVSCRGRPMTLEWLDRKSTRLNSSHVK